MPSTHGMQALDRHRRGYKQTMEVRYVHIHSGAQGVVGIVNASGEDHATRPAQKICARPRGSDPPQGRSSREIAQK